MYNDAAAEQKWQRMTEGKRNTWMLVVACVAEKLGVGLKGE
ncbi:MAG: hypothetical protein AB1760_00030 [Pseudomonadota bacterium]